MVAPSLRVYEEDLDKVLNDGPGNVDTNSGQRRGHIQDNGLGTAAGTSTVKLLAAEYVVDMLLLFVLARPFELYTRHQRSGLRKNLLHPVVSFVGGFSSLWINFLN